jgi:hypothetical protein
MKKNNKYEILTPTGWSDFDGIRKILKSEWVELYFSNKKILKCTLDHPFKISDHIILAENLEIGTEFNSKNGEVVILIEKKYKNEIKFAYDVLEVEKNNLFYANGIETHNCSFLQSGNTVIEMKDILKQEENNIRPPEQKLNIQDKNFNTLNHEEEFWVWEEPIEDTAYIIAADVARGDGLDNSAFSVWKIPNDLSLGTEQEIAPAVQVAEFYGKIKTNDYGRLLETIGLRYNSAIMIVENNSIGIATLNTLTELEYPRLYHTDKAAKRVVTLDEGLNVTEDKIPGFTMSMKTRAAVIDSLETLWRINSLIIRSKRLINEAKTWIWKNGRADHSDGNHDDLIMSSAIFAYLYNTSFRLRARFDHKIEKTLDIIHNRNKGSNIKTQFKSSSTKENNSWELKYSQGNDSTNDETWDLRELLGKKI